jgi:hypothetical protein
MKCQLWWFEHASAGKFLRRLEEANFEGSTYLVGEAVAGNPLVWPAAGRTCTTGIELGPAGADDVRRRDVQGLFEPGEIILELALVCLKELEKEKALFIYAPEQGR